MSGKKIMVSKVDGSYENLHLVRKSYDFKNPLGQFYIGIRYFIAVLPTVLTTI